MGNIFTLRSEIPGKEDLNGKVFMVKCKGVGYESVFIDPTITKGSPIIWSTTVVKSIEKWENGELNGITLTTENTVYNLLNVLSIVPTRKMVKHEESAEELSFHVISSEGETKPINYGDGYRLINFEFDADISREQFIEYCKTIEKLPINETQPYPYANYVVFSGKGRKWQWKEVHCYTD